MAVPEAVPEVLDGVVDSDFDDFAPRNFRNYYTLDFAHNKNGGCLRVGVAQVVCVDGDFVEQVDVGSVEAVDTAEAENDEIFYLENSKRTLSIFT